MKVLQIAGFAIIVFSLICVHLFTAHSGMRGLGLILSPYLIMLILAGYINYKHPTAASHIALFIAALAACIISLSDAYGAIFHSRSSTGGLVFLVMPVEANILFLGAYAIANLLIRTRVKQQQESIVSPKIFKIGSILLLVFGVYFLYSLFRSMSFNRPKPNNEERVFTNGDTTEARRLGVLVKSLHYKVEGFDGTINFSAYIEKGFKYRFNTREMELLEYADYPYSVSFPRKAVKNAAVIIKKGQQYQLEYYNQYLLKKPHLDDTIFLEIKKSGVVLGTIKIWD